MAILPLKEAHYDDLVNFEKSAKYGERQKAAPDYWARKPGQSAKRRTG